MFIGHIAVGFASRRVAPRASLGWLMTAPVLADLLWPIFLLLGWERVRIDPGNTAYTPLDFVSYPISHSLLTLVGWGVLLGAIYWTLSRDRTGAVVIALGVVSHWVLDWITHRPDMPVVPWGGPKLGLSLWNSVPGTMVVELLMFAAGIWLYERETRPRDRTGTVAFVAFVLLLLAMYIGDTGAAPPPSAHTLALVALIGWIVPLWSWWFDRHRVRRR
jgi:membrane-bound metal-dependent hydrolase YbcI (DUF457 family)